jgi:hypothetical protein
MSGKGNFLTPKTIFTFVVSSVHKKNCMKNFLFVQIQIKCYDEFQVKVPKSFSSSRFKGIVSRVECFAELTTM